MTQLKLMASAAGLAFLLIGATSTRAAAPSPYIATSTVDIGWTQTNTGVCGYTLPVGCSFTNSDLGADGSFGKGTVTISGGTDPSVIVTAKAPGSGQDVASVAELIYYIQLVRKPGNIAELSL